MKFLTLGYYIIETISTPSCFGLSAERLLSISKCICTGHPDLKGCFWDESLISGGVVVTHEKEREEYQKLLRLTDENFNGMKTDVRGLYESGKLDSDSRFDELSDAVAFKEKYLRELPDTKIISILLEDSYRKIFIKEMSRDSLFDIDSLTNSVQSGGKFLGYEILGSDYGNFHSYLCNNLQKDISKKYILQVGDFGLIQNPYEQVKEITEYIQGKGEPVHWLPFAVYEHPEMKGQ